MLLIDNSTSSLAEWIQEEVDFRAVRSRGSRGADVERIQEWLSLHHNEVVIDGDFGPATEAAVKDFQAREGLAISGSVDAATHAALVAPMCQTLHDQSNPSIAFGEAIVAFARAHLAEHPREVGGDNRGPWVRLYMNGRDGANRFWCAGFTTFCMKQAAEALALDSPIDGSFSCDNLVAQARRSGNFVSETDATPAGLVPGSFFLIRSSVSDWTHVGIVTEATADALRTIEGNTNDDGNRNGYEVCARTRGYARKDFIIF